ncbi:MAG: hypothetical protein E7510_08290 [Ruminococcus sp.]|nr:hypothetical protein [Ruminococcus sp.]
MTKVVVLFVEGDTEVEFYKALVTNLRKMNRDSFACYIEYKNMRGVGNYKKDALKRLNDIKKKYSNSEIFVFLCYDTDVFEFSKKPPVNMKEVKKDLLNNGAKKVEFIKASKSIEDWFLLDFEGVLKHLRLPKQTPREHGVGQEVLKKLFKKSKRIYIKGKKTEGFIECLDIDKIKKQICPYIRPLCEQIGVNCKNVCGKK